MLPILPFDTDTRASLKVTHPNLEQVFTMWTTERCERCNGWFVTHPEQIVVFRCLATEDEARAWCAVANSRGRSMNFTTTARLTMWRALAARRGRLSDVDWRSSLQAQHLNSVQGVNAARQADDLPPWNRLPRLAAVLTPSGREYEMLWTEG